MSDSSFHFNYTDDESNRFSSSLTGTTSERGFHALKRNNYFYPVYQSCHVPSSVYLEPRTSIPLPNDWTTGSSIHTHGPGTAVLPDSIPFPLPSILCPVPLYSSSSSSFPLQSGYSESVYVAPPFTLKPDSHRATVSSLTRHAEHGGNPTDTHAYHCDPLFGLPVDDSVTRHSRGMPSPYITMPIVPTSLGADTSNHIDPDLPVAPTFEESPCHPYANFRHIPSSDSTLDLGQSRHKFDSESHSSRPSPVGNHAPAISPSEMSNRIHPQLCTTTSPISQFYKLTVPLEAVELPLISGTEEAPFFQCRWADCGIWLTSEKGAVKNHLACIHNVVLKGKSVDPVCCEWVGCSSSVQRNGLVRHFRAHLGLKWLCSLCKTAYTRQDSVWFHTRKEPRCQRAQAVSYPSATAYTATINRDNTITLTKMLQPSYRT